MCPSAASTLSTGRKYQAEAAATADMRKNMRSKAEAAANVVVVCCDMKPTTRFAGLLLSEPLSSHYRSTPSKCKSARFEKASEEIGVPRGKKSERYRSSTAQEMRSLFSRVCGA